MIIIEIISGPELGRQIKVQSGLTVGRSGADIALDDPKVSSVHAKIEADDDGQLFLFDLDSTNGLRVDGQRIKSVLLVPGALFEVGRTQFKVLALENGQSPSDQAEIEPVLEWRQVLLKYLQQPKAPPPNALSKLESFRPALKLVFLKGIQAGQEYNLGYGPRLAGADTLDIELLDKNAPRVAFEIAPGPGAAHFKVLAPGRVYLNNSSHLEGPLVDGDVISVGTTLIKVSYL